ncbi:MAG TPA: HAD hydrolase-like protein [Mycobacterium sp.]|nr:HAD hydrolase-like protein [Mycobacterium sp.]HUH72507.1 HAD hydrolase-like protein [Mycobacterium sp.]
MRLSGFLALSFDCYGTLIDWETGIAAVLAPWAREHDLDIDDERLLAAYGHHETRIEGETPTAPYPEIVAQSMIAVGKDLGVPVSRAEAERLGASVPDWPGFPDSHEALASLAEHYKLFVLSNVDRASFRGSNQRLGVSFTEIITAEDVGSYKPSARNFGVLLAQAAERGIASDQLLHVSQSLFHDHVPAKAAGLATVWINRRHDRPGWGASPAPTTSVTPDWEFPSMAAFAEACTQDRAIR